MVAVGHIALFVSDLRQAESFYQQVFDMALLMRETPLEDQLWYTLPADKGWDDAEAAGIEIKMVALQRDAFVLALFQGKPDPEATILEIGVFMEQEESAALLDRLPDTAERVDHSYGDLMFKDPFGYLWHIRLVGVPFRSNGEGSGRWLEV